jgi:hypothetical protein
MVYAPVLATDGFAYDNECLAHEAGVTVVRRLPLGADPAETGIVDTVTNFVTANPVAVLAAGVGLYFLFRKKNR